jgi:hypothetical protein
MKRLLLAWRGRMRTTMLLVAALAFFALPSSLASAGGKPTRSPVPDVFNTFDFPKGLACAGFELAGAPVVNNEVAKIFPADANGDVRIIVTGSLVERVTNVDSGKSIAVNVSGPVFVTEHPDGSATLDFGGRSGPIVFFPTDIPAGPRAFINSGRVVVTVTPTDQFILVSQSGHEEDVCAALS